MAAPRNTHLTVVADLRAKIKDGTYTRELPSTRKIAQEHGVTHGVAMRAINVLRKEGILHVVHGGGVYIAASIDSRPLTEQLTTLLRDDHLSVGSLLPTEAELSERLGISRTRLRPALALMEGQGLIRSWGSRGRTLLIPLDKEET